MKKALMYTLLAGIIVLLICPYVAGKKLKEGYLARMDSLPEQPGITLNNVSYEQGWFKSHVVTQVDLDLEQLSNKPELADVPVSFLVKSEFSHGPLMFTHAGVRFGLGYGHITLTPPENGTQDSLLGWLAEAPIEIRSIVYFDQRSQTEMEFAAYESDNGDEHIRFGGASISLTANSDMTHFESSMVIQPSSIVGPTATFSMDESSGSMSYSGSSPYTLVGETVFDFNQIVVVDDQLSVSVESLKLNGGSQQNGDAMDFFQTLEFENVQAPIPVTAGKWHFELNAVPVAAIELWADLVDEIEQFSDTDPQAGAAFQAKVQQLSDAIEPGLNLMNRVDLAAMGANHEFSFSFTYGGLPQQGNVFHMDDPLLLLQVFTGSVLVKLNEQAMMNSPFGPMISPYVQQGLLIPVEEDLVLDASLKDGELVVNGNLIPVAEMLQAAAEESAAQP